jgi:transcriptional regulator NrdR family protein
MAFSTCPTCEGKIKVVDSRFVEGEICRRYRCAKCGGLHYSKETMTKSSVSPHRRRVFHLIK